MFHFFIACINDSLYFILLYPPHSILSTILFFLFLTVNIEFCPSSTYLSGISPKSVRAKVEIMMNLFDTLVDF